MIISVQLKHYKVYKNINYIPISDGNNFNAYIGQNGIGKTSILCALDKFFNYESFLSWNINVSALSDGLGENNKPFIVLNFIIKKSEISGKNNLEVATKLDEYFRNTTYTVPSTAKEFTKFYDHRSEIIKKYDKQYLFISIGKKYQDKNAYFGIFDSDLDTIKDEIGLIKINSFLQYLINLYTFIYLPVEINLSEFTKLERKNMQILTNGKLEQAISKSIANVDFKEINNNLDKFLLDLEKDLEQFKYKKNGQKTKFNKNDLVEKIVETYFSTKSLHKKHKEEEIIVENLSSGEKRKALIEILTSFLNKEYTGNKKIIVAIDEPEASLYISNCYIQFQKLYDLAEKNHQIIITSHWYGFLPTLSKGCAINISKKDSFYNFNLIDLSIYREQINCEIKKLKGKIPYDINIKSFNDLAQSIIFSLQKESNYNWIICEGLSEKIYFEYFFKDEIEELNLKILSAGGNSMVKKLYEYLKLPLKDAEKDSEEIKGKIFCLMDTDQQLMTYDADENLKKIKFRRLMSLATENKITMEKISSQLVSPATEIEDCLDSKIYYETLKEFSENNELLKAVLDSNEINETALTSRTALDLRRTEEEKVKLFFNENNGRNKIDFAKKYIANLKENDLKINLEWIEEIKKYFRDTD